MFSRNSKAPRPVTVSEGNTSFKVTIRSSIPYGYRLYISTSGGDVTGLFINGGPL